MPAAIVHFAHSIGDEVKVLALELSGRVIALTMDHEGPSYRVAYWSDGSRKAEWLFAWEIGA